MEPEERAAIQEHLENMTNSLELTTPTLALVVLNILAVADELYKRGRKATPL